MKVKSNVFFNDEFVGEELEAWLNAEAKKGLRVVTLSIVERTDERRVVVRAVFEDKPRYTPLDSNLLAAATNEAAHAHQEVGALTSVLLEIHRLASTISDDVQNAKLIKAALAKCIEPHPQGGTVVNLTHLLTPTRVDSPQG
jgi:hypothetical protein